MNHFRCFFRSARFWASHIISDEYIFLLVPYFYLLIIWKSTFIKRKARKKVLNFFNSEAGTYVPNKILTYAFVDILIPFLFCSLLF